MCFELIFLLYFLSREKMKRQSAEKGQESRNNKKDFKKIRFELSKKALECFISSRVESSGMKTSKSKTFWQEEEKKEKQE